jgi:hypothetical protein
MKFNTKNAYEQDIKILYDNMEILNSFCINFQGVNIANTLSWKIHIDSLNLKLSYACYAIRAIKPFVNQETKLCWWFIMPIFILLFTVALSSGVTLHMALMVFIYKRGWSE